MAGNTDAAVAFFEDLIKRKHKFKMDYGQEIICGKDWLCVIIPKNAKVRKGKRKGKERSSKKLSKGSGSGKSPPKSPPGPPPPKLLPKAPGSTQKYKGKPPTKERKDLCDIKTHKQPSSSDNKLPRGEVNEVDDENSAPVQAAIINSCQEANQEQANAIQASIQATYRESVVNKRATEAEEVDTLVLLADLDDMIDTLESDEEPPNPKKWRANPPT